MTALVVTDEVWAIEMAKGGWMTGTGLGGTGAVTAHGSERVGEIVGVDVVEERVGLYRDHYDSPLAGPAPLQLQESSWDSPGGTLPSTADKDTPCLTKMSTREGQRVFVEPLAKPSSPLLLLVQVVHESSHR